MIDKRIFVWVVALALVSCSGNGGRRPFDVVLDNVTIDSLQELSFEKLGGSVEVAHLEKSIVGEVKDLIIKDKDIFVLDCDGIKAFSESGAFLGEMDIPRLKTFSLCDLQDKECIYFSASDIASNSERLYRVGLLSAKGKLSAKGNVRKLLDNSVVPEVVCSLNGVGVVTCNGKLFSVAVDDEQGGLFLYNNHLNRVEAVLRGINFNGFTKRGLLFSNDNRVLFKFFENDTIFNCSAGGKLSPFCSVNFGERAVADSLYHFDNGCFLFDKEQVSNVFYVGKWLFLESWIGLFKSHGLYVIDTSKGEVVGKMKGGFVEVSGKRALMVKAVGECLYCVDAECLSQLYVVKL